MQKERNNKTRNIILTIFGILIFCVIGTLAVIRDSNDVSQYLVRDNITLNNSGMYYGGEKAFTKTADVVVCRSTSAIDHLKKIFQCDVVCAYTSTSCQSTLNTALGSGNVNILVMKGIYPITSNINIKNFNGVKILGEGIDNTIFLSNGASAIFNLENTSYVEIGSMSLSGNQSATGGTMLYADPNDIIDKIYIHDIYFTGKQVQKTMFSPRGSNWNIERIYFNGTPYNITDNTDVMSTELIDSRMENLYFYNCPASCLTTGEWNNTQVDGLFIDNFALNNIGYGFSLECDTTYYCTDLKLSNVNIKNSNNISRAIDLEYVYNFMLNNINIYNVSGGKYGQNIHGAIYLERSYGLINNLYINGAKNSCIRSKNSNLILNNADLSYCNISSTSTWHFQNAGVDIECTDINCTGMLSGIKISNSLSGINLVYSSLNKVSPIFTIDNIYLNSVVSKIVESNVSTGTVRNLTTSYSNQVSYSGNLPLCEASGIFNENVVYNSTNGCKCTNGAWKCWTMS